MGEWGWGVNVSSQEYGQREKGNREKDKHWKKNSMCKRIPKGDVALKVKTI